MTYTIALEFEQEQRVLNDLAARDAAIELETDLYFQGEFDGKLRLEAKFPESEPYWRGYQEGLRWYYLQKKGIEPEYEF